MLLPILVIRAVQLHPSLVHHLLVGSQHGLVVFRDRRLIVYLKDCGQIWGKFFMAFFIGRVGFFRLVSGIMILCLSKEGLGYGVRLLILHLHLLGHDGWKALRESRIHNEGGWESCAPHLVLFLVIVCSRSLKIASVDYLIRVL
jgi:hypothetical protein